MYTLLLLINNQLTGDSQPLCDERECCLPAKYILYHTCRTLYNLKKCPWKVLHV